MGIRRIVLGSVLSVVLQGMASAAPDAYDDDWNRHHKHRKSSNQMRDYKPVVTSNAVFYDYARVVSVKPVIRTVRGDNPHQYCWDETEYRQSHYQSGYRPQTGYQRTHKSSYTPLILGGILGGVIGNQVGGGTGNDLLTVGGVILGASIGHDIAGRSGGQRFQPARQPRCEVVHDYHEEERIEGYDVGYVYNGHRFFRRMDHPPGRKVRVRVKVTPET